MDFQTNLSRMMNLRLLHRGTLNKRSNGVGFFVQDNYWFYYSCAHTVCDVGVLNKLEDK